MDSNISARWSNDHAAADHRDLQANCMAVNSKGNYAVLAGRKTIAIIDLDKPSEVVKKMTRQSKWEVSSIEWCPTNAHANKFALSCNQKAELLMWREGDEITSLDFLRAHTRVISDLNWSPLDANLLATSSIDTYINIWDVRDPRKPSSSFSAVAGASQVKWNKFQQTILATSHESDVRLWDIRNGNTPIQYISAHSLKIHGLDWSSVDEHGLATSSQDGKVKFWDITNPRSFERLLSSGAPIWRARYTPFGQGLVTVGVPQLRRGENNLKLWNISNMTSSVHTFMGHNDVVLEFQWRRLKNDNQHQYQLVTWSKDQSLRIWTIDPQLLKACGHDTESELIFSDHFEENHNELMSGDADDSNSYTTASPKDTDSVASPQRNMSSITFSVTKVDSFDRKEVQPSSSLSSVDSKSSAPSLVQPKSLQQEFSLIDIDIPNVSIEELNATKRRCSVKVVNGSDIVCLQIVFPATYPNKVCPIFKFLPKTTIDADNQNEILRIIKSTCEQNVKQSKPCLEPCLRHLVVAVKSFSKSSSNGMNDSSFRVEPVQHSAPNYNVYGCLQDSSVPFPRTCGARFSGAGYLVCFARPFHLQNMNLRNDSTPRSLTALAAYHRNFVTATKTSRGGTAVPGVQRSQYNLLYPASAIARSPKNDPNEMSLSMFYSKNKKSKPGRKNNKQLSPENRDNLGLAGQVMLYDVSSLMPVNMSLAKCYTLDDQDIQGTCTKNASSAATFNRKDLVQVWKLAALSASANNEDSYDPSDVPWVYHPFGRKMIQSILNHYIEVQDVQTVAMLCCALGSKTEDINRKKSDSSSYSPGGSPYHTIHSSDTNMDGWNVVCTNLKTNRSNSWSDSLDEMKNVVGIQDVPDVGKDREYNYKLFDPKFTLQYDLYKKIYARLLYRWNYLVPQAQVLKYVSTPPPKHKGIEFLNECQNCDKDVRGAHCLYCKNYSFRCVICNVAVKGSSSFCIICGHGGHTLHMMEWFEKMDICPTGCGCQCLDKAQVFG